MRRYPFRDRVNGTITVIETDYNQYSADFHVHIHGIISYEECIPQEEIETVWRKLTAIPPEGFPVTDPPERIVWIKKIESKSIWSTVGYLFKFRPIEDAEAFAEYDCAIDRVRLIRTYGAMRG
jgi:hypothetical protein